MGFKMLKAKQYKKFQLVTIPGADHVSDFFRCWSPAKVFGHMISAEMQDKPILKWT